MERTLSYKKQQRIPKQPFAKIDTYFRNKALKALKMMTNANTMTTTIPTKTTIGCKLNNAVPAKGNLISANPAKIAAKNKKIKGFMAIPPFYVSYVQYLTMGKVEQAPLHRIKEGI
jgi:hypothetical protein